MDVTLVHHYPHTQHKDLLSATAKLMIEVSALHAGDNGYLDISCHSTIPDYPMNHEEYADVKKKTVSSNYLLHMDDFPYISIIFVLFTCI